MWGIELSLSLQNAERRNLQYIFLGIGGGEGRGGGMVSAK